MLKEKKFKYIFVAVLILVNAVVWSAVYFEENSKLIVAFLDVGQGDAIFIKSPTGNQVLIDGGQNKAVLKQLGKLMPFYDRSLNLVLESHPDADHVGGLNYVLERYKIDAFLEPGTLSKSPDFAELKKTLSENKTKDLNVFAGEILDLGGGAYLEILLPPKIEKISDFDVHNGMMVARLVYGDTEFLLAGDMEKNMENYLLSTGQNIKSDVLKIGHHGSRTSTSESFLGFVSPQYAVISVGADNKYGHPHPETTGLLERFKIPILRTDLLGAVIFESDGSQLKVR